MLLQQLLFGKMIGAASAEGRGMIPGVVWPLEGHNGQMGIRWERKW